MKKSRIPAIAAVLLLATTGATLGQGEAQKSAPTSADCNRVFKAKADAGKSVSTQQLAQELQLPVDTVRACIQHKRRQGPRATPSAAK
jgi:hypothetical protein